MSIPHNVWRPSTVLLSASGLLVAGIGAYFILLRPPLLPEDIRFMQLSSTELASLGPRLGAWLGDVFRVLGGYAVATGILTVALAVSALRQRQPIAIIASIAAGVSSVGLMAAVNFAIDSDFKWPLLVLALLWMASLIAFWIEAQLPDLRPKPLPFAKRT